VKSDVSVFKKNGFEGSVCIKIEADINAFLSVSKASSAFSSYINFSFLVRRVNEAAILE
jgi:hypothetical protein